MTEAINPPEPHSETILEMPDYPVKIWEVFGIGLAGIALLGIAGMGLANQFFSKIQDSKQAESIAHRVVNYEIPGGSKGLMSLSIGSETFALVGSQTNANDVFLLVTQSAIEEETDEPRNFAQELDLKATLIGAWQSGQATTKIMPFCNQPTEVEIRQGQFQLIEQKQATTPAIEYTFQYSSKKTLNRIHLIATGDKAQEKIQQVFKSLKCRKD